VKFNREACHRLSSSLAPIWIVLCIYVIFLAALGFWHAYNPSALIGLGAEDPLNTPDRLPSGLVVFAGSGYDGQYFYHIALNLIRRTHATVDPMRYQRIGYPLLAALFAFGQERMLPTTMLVVNLLAMVTGTWVFIELLRGYNLSPWYSLLFAANLGQILGLQMDLAFPLQLALATGALLFWEKRRLLASAALLAGSILTSESSILFLFPLMAAEALRRRWAGVVILGLSTVPYLAYQVLLLHWMGVGGISTSTSHIVLPFTGMAQVLARSLAGPTTGLLPLVRQGAVLGMMAFMLAASAVSGRKLLRGYDPYTCGMFCHAGASFFASYAIWEAYASAGRVFSGVFPMLVLSYAICRERGSAILPIRSIDHYSILR